MKFEERWYQTDAINATFSYIAATAGKVDEKGNIVRSNPVIELPTGTGKSVVIAGIIERALRYWPKTRFQMLVHDKKLIEQNYDELKALWPNAPVGIFSAGLRRRDTAHQIIFSGIKSVANDPTLFGWRDVAIVDECHLVSPNETTQFQQVLGHFEQVNPWFRSIGLSATPYRAGLGGITGNGIFTDVCYSLSGPENWARLISEGYIAPLITPHNIQTRLDVSDVNITASTGDFVQSQLQAAVDRDEITHAALAEVCELGYNRQSWLIFTTGIEHSEHCAAKLRSFGVKAHAVHSKLDHKETDKRFRDFRNGDVRAICGNNMFTTGFNHRPVDLIGVLRPTAVVAFWVQILGRGTRTFSGSSLFRPKENCLVLDFAGNTRRLGPIDDPRMPRKKGKGTGDAPCCICSVCSCYNHARAVICSACGAEILHEVKIVENAGTDAVLTSTAPIYQWLSVLYRQLHKHGANNPMKPPILKITYSCGIRSVNEWVSIEHSGYAGKHARDWWRKFSGTEPPVTVDEALLRYNELAVPQQIKVWLNKKYPEVVDYSIEGGIQDD